MGSRERPRVWAKPGKRCLLAVSSSTSREGGGVSHRASRSRLFQDKPTSSFSPGRTTTPVRADEVVNALAKRLCVALEPGKNPDDPVGWGYPRWQGHQPRAREIIDRPSSVTLDAAERVVVEALRVEVGDRVIEDRGVR